MTEKTLNFLRSEIDKIDQDLLYLLSKRFFLVSEVGEIKSQLGLFIYDPDREAKMIACRRQEAVGLGISPDLVEDILRRIMRESYHSESEKGFKNLCPNLGSIVIIGGKGKMGQFFCKMLSLSGYTVRILDKDDWVDSQIIFINVSMVLISVPIHLVTKIINQLPTLPDNCIIVDLSSIKKSSLNTILSVHTGPVLGLHPMFSPDIGGGIVKQVIIYCDGRFPDSYQWFLQQIKLWGVRLHHCDIVEHDQYMSVMQGLCHFITFITGYNLFQENIDLKKLLSFASPVFRLELIMIGRFFSQNPQLYANIIMESQDNIILIKKYYRLLGKMLKLLENNDKQDFINKFERVKNWLNVYIDVFFKNSCNVLYQINDFRENDCFYMNKDDIV